MKLMLLDTYYPRFLERFYASRTEPADYESGLQALLRSRFGTSDFYSRHLRAAGVDAADWVINDINLQAIWGAPRGLKPPSLAARALGRLWPARRERPFLERCALAQIRETRPDVAYAQDTGWFSPEALREIKAMGVFLVGQIACPMPAPEKMREFDLVITSFPHYVASLRHAGQAAEYLKLAFEPRVLSEIGPRERIYQAAFIGGMSGHHRSGIASLEAAAHEVPIDVWGYGAEELSAESPLRRRFHGEAWALQMFEILAQAKIALNRHIDVAEGYANNMRLFEATGMGALLLTDAKQNLGDLFVDGEEIVAYRDARDLAEKIAYFAHRPNEASAIAAAGQRRTLSEHTYEARMAELKGILERHLRSRPSRRASRTPPSSADARGAWP